MKRLDPRLRLIAEMTPPSVTVADVGCDHGALIAALLETGRARFGIATDIHPRPLEKAVRELEQRGLSARSDCRLTDGLSGVAPTGLDAVIIAGMGGEQIARILSAFAYRENPAIVYLLQPMTRAVTLRGWLYGHGFELREERCALASGRLYSVMKAVYTGRNVPKTAAALYFGAVDPGRDPYGEAWRRKVLRQVEKRLAGLAVSRNAADRDGEIAGTTRLLLALRGEGDSER